MIKVLASPETMQQKAPRQKVSDKFFSFFGRGKTTHNISKMKLKQPPMTAMPDLLNVVQGIQEKEQVEESHQ